MKILIILIIAMLCVSGTVSARPPSRGPAVEAGSDNVRIDLPDISIEGTYHLDDSTYGGGKKENCGGDCRDGTTKRNASPISPAIPVVAPSKDMNQQLAEKELNDAAKAWVLEDDDKPLENSSIIVSWAIDKLKETILGPISELFDALESKSIGLTDFDNVKNNEQLKGLRAKLELEEREFKKQKEENLKAYEENIKLLFPSTPIETEINRNPASLEKQVRLENAIKALAKLKSDDLYVVADHIIRRTKINAPIRLTTESSEKAANVLRGIAPANTCKVSNKHSCVLFGVAQGANCYCPEFRDDNTWKAVSGIAVRSPLGQYCRRDDVSIDMHQIFPIGVRCRIPVDLTFDSYNPHFEYISGFVSKEKCESYSDRMFKSECE